MVNQVHMENNLSFNQIKVKNVVDCNHTFDINVLRNLTFSSLNVNTLNISTHNEKFLTLDSFNKKIVAFLKHTKDILFIQDLRLNSRHDTLQKAIRVTKYGNFTLFSNSFSSKRGGRFLFPFRMLASY